MANRLVSQGVINRLRASIVVVDNPELNITASYLGPSGISIAFDGPFTTQIDQMTGATQSPEPFVPVTITIPLIRAQALANVYKQRVEVNTLIGDITVRGDASTLDVYQFTNGAIDMSPAELAFSGKTADFNVRIKAYYNINDSLYNV